MLIPNTLRIDRGNGSSIIDYRIQDGGVESRIVDSATVRTENGWRPVRPEQLSSHVMSNSVVAQWLRCRMGLHALLRACSQDDAPLSGSSPECNKGLRLQLNPQELQSAYLVTQDK